MQDQQHDKPYWLVLHGWTGHVLNSNYELGICIGSTNNRARKPKGGSECAKERERDRESFFFP